MQKMRSQDCRFAATHRYAGGFYLFKNFPFYNYVFFLKFWGFSLWFARRIGCVLPSELKERVSRVKDGFH